MKNVSVSVDDEVYRRARVRAAELHTSVSQLVRRFLVAFAREDMDFERRKRLQDETLASIRSFRAGGGTPRDDAHERLSTLEDITGLWQDRADLEPMDAYVRRLRRDSRRSPSPE